MSLKDSIQILIYHKDLPTQSWTLQSWEMLEEPLHSSPPYFASDFFILVFVRTHDLSHSPIFHSSHSQLTKVVNYARLNFWADNILLSSHIRVINQIFTYFIPGHGCKLHATYSFIDLSPSQISLVSQVQLSPPGPGGGLLQAFTFFCVPPPQGLSQSVTLYSPHPPWTKNLKINNFSNRTKIYFTL